MLDQQDGTATGHQARFARAPSPLPAVDFLSPGQVRAHPRWQLARDCAMQQAVDSRGPDPAIKRLMQDVARLVLFNIIIGLHEAQGEDRSTWPTINRIRKAFDPFGLASPRCLDAMIARMSSIGLVELHPAPGDRRLRLVVPTARMIAEDYSWQDANMRALAVLQPDSRDYDPVFAHDPAYRLAHRALGARINGTARAILDTDANPLVAFLTRQDGARIVFSYLLAALAGGDPHRVSLSYDTVSARISTSRTHVRNLVVLLEAEGYLRRHGTGGQDLQLLPPLWDEAERFIASVLSGNDYWWQLTRAHMAASGHCTQ